MDSVRSPHRPVFTEVYDMFRTRWIDKLLAFPRSGDQRRRTTASTRRFVRPRLELLEDRIVPADPTTLIPGNATINFYGTNPSPAFNVPVLANDNLGGTASGGTVFIFLIYNGSTPPPPVLLGANTVGTNGTALISVPAGALPTGLQTGSYQLEETYSGSGTNAPTNAFGTLTIVQDPTTVVAGNASINYYDATPSPAFTIQVGVNSPAGTVNSGSVSVSLVSDNSVTNLTPTPATVTGGLATATVAAGTLPANLQTGTYQLIETYTDVVNGQFATSTGTGTLTINAAPTTVVAGNASINYYDATPSPAFTIQVGVNSPAGTVNSGSVSVSLVSDNTTTLLTPTPVAVSANGTATINVAANTLPANLQVGDYQLIETYIPSTGSQFAGSNGTGTLAIAAAPTTVVAGNAIVNVGTTNPFTVSAAVNSPAGTVNSGTVTFVLVSDNSTTTLGTAAVSGGVATLSVTGTPRAAIAALPSGRSWQLVETYADVTGGQFAGSSAIGTLTVNPVPTPSTTIIPGNAVITTNGGTVTVPVAVNSPGGTVNTGTVTISLVHGNSTSVVGSAPVSGGVANVPITVPAGLPVGAYTLVETYSDGNQFFGSSASGMLTVNPATPPLTAGQAALELAIDLAAIPLLLSGNTGALMELEMFSRVLTGQPFPMSIPQLLNEIGTLVPQTGGLLMPAISGGMFLAQETAAENPMS
jgi:hypothetical protein